MTPAQSRAARELLQITQTQLADMADLSHSTVEAFEAGGAVHERLVDALQVTLEAAGAEFIVSGAGVRLRERKER